MDSEGLLPLFNTPSTPPPQVRPSPDSPDVPDSDPMNEFTFTSPTVEMVFGDPSQRSFISRPMIFQLSQSQLESTSTSPINRLQNSAATSDTTSGSAETSTLCPPKTGLFITTGIKPLVRRVPPHLIPKVESPPHASTSRKKVAMRFTALESHFKYFRHYHRDLIAENDGLSNELKLAREEIKQQSKIHENTEKLQSDLAEAIFELEQARAYLAELRRFSHQGWVNGQPQAGGQ